MDREQANHFARRLTRKDAEHAYKTLGGPDVTSDQNGIGEDKVGSRMPHFRPLLLTHADQIGKRPLRKGQHPVRAMIVERGHIGHVGIADGAGMQHAKMIALRICIDCDLPVSSCFQAAGLDRHHPGQIEHRQDWLKAA